MVAEHAELWTRMLILVAILGLSGGLLGRVGQFAAGLGFLFSALVWSLST